MQTHPIKTLIILKFFGFCIDIFLCLSCCYYINLNISGSIHAYSDASDSFIAGVFLCSSALLIAIYSNRVCSLSWIPFSFNKNHVIFIYRCSWPTMEGSGNLKKLSVSLSFTARRCLQLCNNFVRDVHTKRTIYIWAMVSVCWRWAQFNELLSGHVLIW